MSFKDKKNVYLCRGCGRGQITLDVDDGTTPMFMPCLTCGAMATSCMYNIPQPWLADFTPAIEWYRPDTNDGLTEGQMTHVARGGLLSRVVTHQEEAK